MHNTPKSIGTVPKRDEVGNKYNYSTSYGMSPTIQTF